MVIALKYIYQTLYKLDMYKNILVPHAGTPGGDNALNHAMHIAKASNAKITILHIVEEVQYPPTLALSSSERDKIFNSVRTYSKEIQKKMKLEMQKLAEKCEKNGLKSEIKIVAGSAPDEILKLVNKNIDLVVMAKRRKLKGIKKLLSLGSVSRKVVENAICPVLLIDVEKS